MWKKTNILTFEIAPIKNAVSIKERFSIITKYENVTGYIQQIVTLEPGISKGGSEILL